jgi:hypothetical protein
VAKDVYVRLTPRGPRTYGVAAANRSLVFVDLHHDDIDELRKVPQGVIDRPEAVLVRCEAAAGHPDATDGCPAHRPSFEDLVSIKKRLQLTCPIGLICQETGKAPRIELAVEAKAGSVEMDTGEERDLIERARAVELRALLDWGDAVWRPSDYHYRLPSGKHAGVFVRVADAIRQPRDAQVLASWLRPHLANGLAIVCDSGTISAVVESLKADALAAKLKLAGSAVLERYPASPLDVSQAVQDVIANASSVLGVISVNSSGQVASWLHGALSAKGGAIDSWALAIMVDHESRSLDNISSWLPLRDEDEKEKVLDRQRSSNSDTCELCSDPATARLIPINPTSFDGMLPSQVRQLMPRITDAQRNAPYWEHCSQTKAIGLIETPDTAVRDFRPSPEQMPVHFRLVRLLGNDAYRRGAAESVRRLVADHRAKTEANEKDEGARYLTGEADLVLVPEHETKHPGYDELWKLLGPEITTAGGGVSYTPFPVNGDWTPELLEAVGNASDIVILAVGLVTGGSLTRALTRVQALRRRLRDERGFTIRALVLHARPERLREWESLENAFNRQLFAVWNSLIATHEPLREEAEVLKDVDTSDLDVETSDFHSERSAFCSGDGRELTAMFWGARSEAQAGPDEEIAEDRLSPNSLYGEQLDGITTLIAVGAAMERSRQESRQSAAPEMRVFELAALTMSYFDPMILAATFRSLRPEEAWWGERPEDAQKTMQWIVDRADAAEPAHLRILMPELLLAIAQGKVPDRAAEVAERKAEALLGNGTFSGRDRAALALGLEVARTRKRKWPALSRGFEESE